jgi:predicted HicB family RNase H-like nuclease
MLWRLDYFIRIANRQKGDYMGTSSTKAKNKWNAANYDRIVVSVPKGSKDKIKSKAAAAGKSLNKYILDLLEK